MEWFLSSMRMMSSDYDTFGQNGNVSAHEMQRHNVEQELTGDYERVDGKTMRGLLTDETKALLRELTDTFNAKVEYIIKGDKLWRPM